MYFTQCIYVVVVGWLVYDSMCNLSAYFTFAEKCVCVCVCAHPTYTQSSVVCPGRPGHCPGSRAFRPFTLCFLSCCKLSMWILHTSGPLLYDFFSKQYSHSPILDNQLFGAGRLTSEIEKCKKVKFWCFAFVVADPHKHFAKCWGLRKADPITP